MNDWDKLYGAALEVQNERSVSSFIEAGSVAAALLTGRGHIYRGVCIDTACSLGMCAERNAIANMITNGEDEIDKILIIMPDGRPGLPCGACMELMMQLGANGGETEILTDLSGFQTAKLKSASSLVGPPRRKYRKVII